MRLKKRPDRVRGKLSGLNRRNVAVGSAAAGVAMLAAGGLLWRSLAGGSSDSGVGDTAVLTAESVLNAAQAHMIDVVEHANEPDVALITRAAREAVREAASAGADITAAATGAARGAAQVHRDAGVSVREAVDAARQGALDVAASISGTAERRVREALAKA